ncbi:MAG: tetratricopeptide repeat protein [Burkholderiaceae bacterium]|nr:tetratricopeptide repeat protein [Burkholderiaceae bacterium]
MRALNAWFYAQIANWAMVLKKFEIAAEYWLRVAEAKPEKGALPLTTAATCMAEVKRNHEAEALLRKAIEVEPSYSSAWFNLGFLIQKREDHEEALHCFDQAIRHQEKMDRAHYGRALSLIAMNRPAEAKAALERTIDLQPMSPYGYYQLASLHHRLGDEKACIKLVKKLHKFEPQLAVQLQRETGVQAGVEDPFAKYRR